MKYYHLKNSCSCCIFGKDRPKKGWLEFCKLGKLYGYYDYYFQKCTNFNLRQEEK